MPGITAAARRDDDNPYGPTVTLAHGGRAWWTTTGATPPGPSPAAGRLVPAWLGCQYRT